MLGNFAASIIRRETDNNFLKYVNENVILMFEIPNLKYLQITIFAQGNIFGNIKLGIDGFLVISHGMIFVRKDNKTC